jgi:hypothetical protein
MKQFVTTPYDFTAEKIRAIKSSTLIITGDGDGVLPEHAVEMFRLRNGKYMIDFGPAASYSVSHISGYLAYQCNDAKGLVAVHDNTLPGCEVAHLIDMKFAVNNF